MFSLNIKANDDIIYIRNLFYRSIKSYESADSLSEFMKNINTKYKPEYIAYKGMAKLMICYHTYNPYIKYKYFVDGKDLLESALKKDPDNIEVKFLRLTVQLNTPSFLGYTHNIQNDKLAILQAAKYIEDSDLYVRIYNYTINAKKLTTNERLRIQKALLENNLANNLIIR